MDISTGEHTSVKNRREKVHEAFKRLNIKTEGDVPVVAVLGSGGGLRAMIGFLGVLSELANDDILDTITYISGTSGSTWCMSSLYDNDNWSNCIGEMEGKICKTFEKEYDLQKSWEKLKQTKENDTASLTSFWAYVIIHMMTKDVNEKKLSDYCGACEIGSNPYPVYAAVEKTNVNNGIKHKPETWFEFTPHTSGFPAYEEYVDTKLLGSKFEQGKVSKSQPEREVCFLQGIWGSALGSEKVMFDVIKEQIKEIWSKLWSINARSKKDENEGNGPLMRKSINESFITHENEGNGPLMRKSINESFITLTSHGKYCKCAHLKELLAEDLESLDYKQSEEFLQKLKQLLEDVEEKEISFLPLDVEEKEISFLPLDVKEKEISFRSLDVEEKEISFLPLDVEETEISFLPLDVKEKAISFLPLGNTCWKLEMIGFLLMYLKQWEWGTTHNFLYDPSKSDDIFKSQYIHLIDAGLEINTAYPLILRPERKVDLILSFDFSEGDPFLTLTEAEEYCLKNNIRFPKINIKEEEKNIPSKSCYIFGNDENDVPVVMHFPLFNKMNCGDNVEGWRDRYQTLKLLYTPSDIEDLLKVSKQIVTLSKNEILDKLQQQKKAP